MWRCRQVQRVERAILEQLVNRDLQDLLDQVAREACQVRPEIPVHKELDLLGLVPGDNLDQLEYLDRLDLKVQFHSIVTFVHTPRPPLNVTVICCALSFSLITKRVHRFCCLFLILKCARKYGDRCQPRYYTVSRKKGSQLSFDGNFVKY